MLCICIIMTTAKAGKKDKLYLKDWHSHGRNLGALHLSLEQIYVQISASLLKNTYFQPTALSVRSRKGGL